jgi:hypothetical protein
MAPSIRGSKSTRSWLRSPVADSWWRRLLGLAPRQQDEQAFPALERPWLERWDHLPKRSAGPGFTRTDYVEARERARQVAQATLGPELYARLQRQGYLDLPSRLHPGITYRLRVGRRIQVMAPPGVYVPWPYPFLCINPTYPLPEEEFFAHLYLYVRDREDVIVQVAAPQPWDQALGRTF